LRFLGLRTNWLIVAMQFFSKNKKYLLKKAIHSLSQPAIPADRPKRERQFNYRTSGSQAGIAITTRANG
jgi:hypothetical protein